MSRYQSAFITLIFALLLYSGGMLAQPDSLVVKDDYVPSSNSELISRYRSLIMDQVVQENQPQARKYFHDLLRRFDNQFYLPLYPDEKWMLCLITGDYGLMISEVVNMDSVQAVQMRSRILPSQDQLYSVLIRQVIKNKARIESNIRDSAESSENQDFLMLMLNSLTMQGNQNEQIKINSMATGYMNDYPASKFENYIRNFIRYEYKLKGFSFGMELYSGAVVMGGTLSDYVQDNGTIGVGFIWGLGRLHVNTRVTIVFNKIQRDIQVNSYTWAKGSDAEVYLPEISLGYKFNIAPKFHLSPVAGICWYQVAPVETDKRDNSNLKDVKVNARPGPVVGVDFGWDFFVRNTYNYAYNRPVNSYYGLYARYTIQPVNFPAAYSHMNGIAHNISVGIKFGLGGSKRVY